jgi:hypothetical protein
MAALALMILVVAVLATGATRHEVYRSNVGRVGGRIGETVDCRGFFLISKLNTTVHLTRHSDFSILKLIYSLFIIELQAVTYNTRMVLLLLIQAVVSSLTK